MFITSAVLFLVMLSASYGWHMLVELLEHALASSGLPFLASLGAFINEAVAFGDLVAFIFVCYRLIMAGTELLEKVQLFRFSDWLILAIIWPFYGFVLLYYLYGYLRSSRA